jgi:hypothetical protein
LETLSVENVIAGSISGSVSVRADQTLSYTPAADFTGTETFSYTLSDGRGGTSVATVTVNVDVANPPPNAQDDSFSLSEDDPQAAFDVLANDSTDDATETLSISDVGTSSEGSVVQIAGDGQSILYTPAANFNGTEVITYTLQDSGGATATAEVTFAVAAVNDAPQAVNDTETALAGNASTTIEVLDNDLDLDGDELKIIEVTQPGDGNGTISIASDGKSLLYEPPSDDFESLISFSYTVEDPSGETDTATVEIDVRDFVPTTISGDTVFDLFSLSAGGFDVRLTGNDFAGNVVSRNTTVGAGNVTGYKFADLPPGNYMLERDPLPFLWDTGESIEIVAAMDGGEIQQDLSITGSLRPQYFDIRDFLGSSFGNSLTVAMHDDGSVAWSMGTGEWSELSTLDVQLDDDDVLNVAAEDAQSRSLSGELSLNEPSSPAYQAGVQTPYRLLRVPGTPAAVGIEEQQSASTGEGEAASGTPVSDNTLVGEGEAFPTPGSNSDSVQSSSTLPAPSIASVSTTEAASGSRLSNATLSRRMSLATADNESSGLNRSPMSQVAVDEAMKSVLPKLEVALSPSLEDALLGSSDADLRDQAILQL